MKVARDGHVIETTKWPYWKRLVGTLTLELFRRKTNNLFVRRLTYMIRNEELIVTSCNTNISIFQS